MSEIRPITPDEILLAHALYKNAYKITSEQTERWTKLTDLTTTRAIVDNGRVLSILTIHSFEVWMFGKLMPMGGIGGVATFADQQGKGLAGKLIEQAILDMRDAGQVLSILYPFSFQFYGRYGYTLSGDYITYEASPRDFATPALDDNIRIRATQFPKDRDAIKQAYDTAAPIWNCMVNRTELHWDRWIEYWTADRRHVYLLESTDDGSPEGYFCVDDIPLAEINSYVARVPEIVLSSPTELPWLARFFSRSAASVKSVKLTLPRTPQLWQLFREPRVATVVHPQFQARIIDLVRACELRGYESDIEVDITFSIDDIYAPWNAGPWRLKVSDGIAEVSPVQSQKEGLILTIQEFTAIFTGYQKASDLILEPGPFVEELEAFDDAFYDGETRLLNFF